MQTFTFMNEQLGSTILMVTHDAVVGSYASRFRATQRRSSGEKREAPPPLVRFIRSDADRIDRLSGNYIPEPDGSVS